MKPRLRSHLTFSAVRLSICVEAWSTGAWPTCCRHVLHEQRIDTDLCQTGDKILGGLELILIEDGVDGDIDLRAEAVGIVAQRLDILHTVACSGAGTEMVGTDIHGIGAMTDGGKAAFEVLGGRQEFKGTHAEVLITR